MSSNRSDPTVVALLRAFLDAVTLADTVQERIWAAAELRLTHVRALRRLAKGTEPKSLGQLADELGLTPPSVTRVVDSLEERGLVERRRDDTDRRKIVAALLPAGLGLVTSVPFFEVSGIQRAAEMLEPADRERIAAAFEDFARAVRAVEQGQGDLASAPVAQNAKRSA